MHKKKNWVLLADAGHARILERTIPFGKLNEVHTLSHSHKLTHELGRDKPGRNFERASPTRHSYELPDQHELQKKEFAKELARIIQEGYRTNQFEELYIFSASHMLGLLRHYLNKYEASTTITKEYPKDILALPLEEIQTHIDNLPQTKSS